MEILWTLLLGAGLIVATVLLHYEILRGISQLMPKLSMPVRSRILLVLGGVFMAHLLEVCLYGAVFYLMANHLGLGTIAGQFNGDAMDYLYFSITSYTTLGIGDVFPHGPVRFVAGLEALNGFVLIGWSASFTYLAMEKFWSLHPPARRLVKS